MEQKTKTTTLFRVIRLFLLCFLGISFIVFCSLALKKICIKSVHAEEQKYIHILKPTPLYKTNTLEGEIITMPEGYYAEILSMSGDLVRVNYNSVVGFIKFSSDHEITSMPTNSLFQEAEIKSKSDAGTYLRSEPNTNSNKTAIIPPNTALEYIGEIKGALPTDGTSETWFYVHYFLSDTLVHTGYIYSERVEVLSGKVDRPIVSTPSPENENKTTATTPTNDMITDTPISAGVKIFLGILFSTLGIIIFALLIISPHEKKESSRPSVHGQNINSFNENRTKNGDFTTKHGDFVPKNAQKLTIFDKTPNFSRKNTPAQQNLGQKTTKIAQNSENSASNIPPESARGAISVKNNKNISKNNKNFNDFNKNYTASEFATFEDFSAPKNSHQITPKVKSSVKHKFQRKQNLHLLGENKDERIPSVLSRYFDIE